MKFQLRNTYSQRIILAQINRSTQVFEGKNANNLAISFQYYLLLTGSGIFKSTKSKKWGPGPITKPSIGTQGHAMVSDGWYLVAESITFWKKKMKLFFEFFC